MKTKRACAARAFRRKPGYRLYARAGHRLSLRNWFSRAVVGFFVSGNEMGQNPPYASASTNNRCGVERRAFLSVMSPQPDHWGPGLRRLHEIADQSFVALDGAATVGRLSDAPSANGAGLFRGVLGLGAEDVVGLRLIPDHVIRVGGRRVARRLVRPDAGRHRGDRPVDGAVAEKGKRVPLAARAVDGAVRCRQEAVVGPALQQLAAVHDKGAGDGGRLDPLAACGADRE